MNDLIWIGNTLLPRWVVFVGAPLALAMLLLFVTALMYVWSK